MSDSVRPHRQQPTGLFCPWDFPGKNNEAEVYVFSGTFLLFDDPMDVGNLISGSSDFAKTSLNIWKLTVNVLLRPGLENFEHYLVCELSAIV